MALTVCTHPARCGDMEAAHSDMATQLCAAWVEVAGYDGDEQRSEAE